MSFITTFMKNVKDFYSEINAATLTGAIDVIVVEHEDGSLNSSPFHVRFGKMGVLKSREKIVDLEINGEPVDIWMKLDDTGAAFFVEDVEDSDDTFNPDLATSPLPKKIDHYFETESNQTILPDVTEQPEVDADDLEESEDKRNLRKKRKTRRELMLTRSGSRKCPVDEMFDMEDTDDEASMGKELSISELVDVIDPDREREPTRISFSSGYISDQEFAEGKSVPLPDYQALMSKSVGSDLLSDNLTETKISQTFSEPSMMHLTEAEEMGEDVSWKWGELPKHDEVLAQTLQTEEAATAPENKSSWFSWSKKTAKTEETEGVYLDDIEQNPDLVEKYIGTYNPDQSDPLSLEERNQSDDAVLLSVCGSSNLSESPVTNEKFQSNLINYDSFVEKVRKNPNFLADSEILLRLNGKYLPWPTAAPILLSRLLFKANLPSDVEKELTVGCQNAESKKENDSGNNDVRIDSKKSWFGWFGKSDDVKNPSAELTQELSELKIDVDLANSGETEASTSSAEVTPANLEAEKRFRKTIRLTSEQLKKLNLKKGMNEVEFSVTTAFQGTTRCECHIYLWHHTDKVVISDIDGTITKSDVLGHLLPVIGRDWAQSGVAHLYTKIRNNGYQIIYLSARAIGQASVTKDYLQSLKQGDVCLPDGPLFLNPDSLIHAFKREVIDRNPEEFKIRCLKDIQSLFNGKNPFFAGYGNRPNDAYAYRAVGIPVSRIFTINPAGELRHELTQNFQTSYESLSTEVDYYFPNIQTVKQIKEKFDAFPRKQSVYFDASDYMSIEEVAVEASENLSDTEEQVKPFRLRSGTDISDSLSTARLKLKNLKSKKVELQSQWSINEDGFEQIE